MIRKLIVDACGPEYARRFFLKDGEGNFWNEQGQTWTGNFVEAGLWADGNEIAEKMHELMMSQIPGELHTFVAPVVVEVKSQGPVDVQALQNWLNEAVSVFMNAQKGVGPDGCMVMLHIDWEEIKETDNEPNP